MTAIKAAAWFTFHQGVPVEVNDSDDDDIELLVGSPGGQVGLIVCRATANELHRVLGEKPWCRDV